MHLHRMLSLLPALGLFAAVAQAQPPQAAERIQFVHIETIRLALPDSGMSRVDVLYRIERGFFVATRVADSLAGAPFRRSGEILVEMFDSTNTSRARSIEPVAISETRPESAPGEKGWHEGHASFTLPPGPYRVYFEATDRNSSRRFVNPPVMVRVTTPPAAAPSVGAVFFGSTPDTAAPHATILENLGGDLLFGYPRGVWVELILWDSTISSADVAWSLQVHEGGEEEGKRYAADTVRAAALLHGVRPVAEISDRGISYTFKEGGPPRTAFLFVPLPTATLPLRNYSLKLDVLAGGTAATGTKRFRTVWPEMPQSLKNVEAAIEALRFIASESTLDSLQRGGFEEQRDALEAFWNRRNRTPATARNELMTEYYRRVDAATREYGTLREPDGTRTDRGRIYVLNGPPARVDRKLNPSGGHMEIWVYERPPRTFTFIDESRNGTYLLRSATP